MLVEDNPEVREAVATALEVEGYSVVQAAHAEEALRQLRTSTLFCLILLDLYMPTTNGWAFRAEQLRDAKLAPIPVIVVSADGAVAQLAADLGAAGYVGKPIDFEQLLWLVAAHC